MKLPTEARRKLEELIPDKHKETLRDIASRLFSYNGYGLGKGTTLGVYYHRSSDTIFAAAKSKSFPLKGRRKRMCNESLCFWETDKTELWEIYSKTMGLTWKEALDQMSRGNSQWEDELAEELFLAFAGR